MPNIKFLIIGNINAVTYKETFPLIKDNKLWIGVSIHSGDREFQVPNDYPLDTKNSRIDENGTKFIRVTGIRWFTNLEHTQRHEELILYKEYNNKDYPMYDNYGAINVDKTKDIPCDYYKPMGVPITFLDKHNPDQFEILNCCEPCIDLKLLKNNKNFKEYKSRQITRNNKVCQKTYHRILIKRVVKE